MNRIAIIFSVMMVLLTAATLPQTAYGWCTPRILHCGDIIDSSTVAGHDDVSRFNCTGSTNWNGKAHVYKITHAGDSLWLQLDWTGDADHTIGMFVLSDCNATHCIAYNAHELKLRLNAGTYWIIVDSKKDYGTQYRLKVFCGDYRLPVELTSFSASDQSDGVHLAWSTASETDNTGFRVERQRQDTEDWELLAFVPGQGQSTSRTTYGYVDPTAENGTTYAYRLISVDMNSEAHELQLVTATHGTPAPLAVPAEFRVIGNYPNPFNPSTRIVFDLSDATDITVNVFDVNGRLVQTLAAGEFEAGRQEVTFDASGLPSGVYFAQIQGLRQSQMLKMVLMK